MRRNELGDTGAARPITAPGNARDTKNVTRAAPSGAPIPCPAGVASLEATYQRPITEELVAPLDFAVQGGKWKNKRREENGGYIGDKKYREIELDNE